MLQRIKNGVSFSLTDPIAVAKYPHIEPVISYRNFHVDPGLG